MKHCFSESRIRSSKNSLRFARTVSYISFYENIAQVPSIETAVQDWIHCVEKFLRIDGFCSYYTDRPKCRRLFFTTTAIQSWINFLASRTQLPSNFHSFCKVVDLHLSFSRQLPSVESEVHGSNLLVKEWAAIPHLFVLREKSCSLLCFLHSPWYSFSVEWSVSLSFMKRSFAS